MSLMPQIVVMIHEVRRVKIEKTRPPFENAFGINNKLTPTYPLTQAM
jgi:hypothetical protein